jgi:hypothetical protein
MLINKMLIYLLIVFFKILIFYQLVQSYQSYQSYFDESNYIIEGLTTPIQPSQSSQSSQSSQQYQPYDTNNPNNVLILAQQNAGNIQVLKQQIDKTLGLEKEVRDISGNVATLTEQVTAFMQQQQTSANALLPSSPPNITGST